ncbi:MAG: protein kinase [Kineosporiaceae bacterium]
MSPPVGPAPGRRGPDPGHRFSPGDRVGAYVVTGLAGVGSTAAVYRARHAVACGDVALKVRHQPLDATCRRRFARECLVHWAVSGSPGVVRMHTASGVDEPEAWLAMELFDEPLSERLRRGALPPAEAREAALAVVDAVAAVHAAGFVHRDVNPGNVLLATGRAALGDFGSADHGRRPGADPAEGTPPYRAPELLRGRDPGPVSDLYSTAMTVRTATAGCAPPELTEALRVAAAPEPEARSLGLEELREVLLRWCPR